MKKLLLLGFCLFAGISFSLDEFKNPFSSGIDRLDDIEMDCLEECIEKYAIDCQSEIMNKQVNDQQIIMREQYILLMSRFLSKIFVLANQIDEEFFETSQEACKFIRKICMDIKKDPELTVLVKEIVGVCADAGIEFVSTVDYEKLIDEDMTDQELLQLIDQYMPQEKDLCDAIVNFIIWQQEYCKNKLLQNNELSIDDITYVMQKLSDFCKFPKKSDRFWNDLCVAINKGLKSLPQSVVAVFLKSSIKHVENVESLQTMSLLKSIMVMRKNLMQKSAACISEKEYKAYQDLLNKYFEQLGNNVSDYAVDMYDVSVISKVFFTN